MRTSKGGAIRSLRMLIVATLTLDVSVASADKLSEFKDAARRASVSVGAYVRRLLHETAQ